MSVLIDSISEPLGVAEQALDITIGAASMHPSDPSPRFNEDGMRENLNQASSDELIRGSRGGSTSAGAAGPDRRPSGP
jgi:hypothetical protein